ncbi:MAG: DUF2520 domain-containing protein [Actinomycetaceae bacterium]|nr:DUF2520 domain-containing protein [Actinomycetaceae bacterium]
MKPGRLRISVIGAGRVGPILAKGWAISGHEVVAITRSSNPLSNDRVQALHPGVPLVDTEDATDADLVLVTVSDDQIKPVVDGLGGLGAWKPGQIVLHTCGAHGTDVLDTARAVGAIPIALHPPMSFTGWSIDLERLINCPVAVTAPAIALPIAQALVYELEANPVIVEEHHRGLYHAALTHGANHLHTLILQAVRALGEAGVEEPERFIEPLASVTVERALSEGVGGLTGPVARADTGTLTSHIQRLQAAGLDDIAQTYMELAQATAALALTHRKLTDAQYRDVVAALLLAD